MTRFTDQLKQVARRLSRSPLFTVITLLTLAIGVGANTVIFSVVEGVLLKPLPYPHADRLIGVWQFCAGDRHQRPEYGAFGLLHRSRAE